MSNLPLANPGRFDFDADGDSEPFTYNGSKGTITSVGDFGGGTLTLLVSAQGVAGPFIPDEDFSHTAPKFDSIAQEIPRGLTLKFNLAGSTSPDLGVIFTQGRGS